jgi:hypothetical protein
LQASAYDEVIPDVERHLSIPSGLSDRIDRIRADEPFEHWARHQLEAAVLEREYALGLVSARDRDQIETQDNELERQRDQGEPRP